MHEEEEIWPILGDKKHSNNNTDCSHEKEECTSSFEKDKNKIKQGMEAKQKLKLKIRNIN